MVNFYMSYKKSFNKSQYEVLKRVAHLPENEALLIQGPPGTGKTHTITGIISMLIGAGARKIMICAPSNAAVDEIVCRLSVKGLLGVKEDVKSMILRIGASEYEPSPEVKKFMLDERLKVTMNDARTTDLRD